MGSCLRRQLLIHFLHVDKLHQRHNSVVDLLAENVVDVDGDVVVAEHWVVTYLRHVLGSVLLGH